LVPSFVVVRSGCETLLRRSRARDVGIYGELAALVLGLGPDVAYVECRGLDWETPDRYRRAVRRIGLPAWRRRQETPAEWALRVQLARDIVRALEHTVAKRPVRTLCIRRLPARPCRAPGPGAASRLTRGGASLPFGRPRPRIR
jgi:hypothetical protein